MEDKEIKAMSIIAGALGAFDESETETVRRILKWAASRYGITGIERGDSSNQGKEATPAPRTDGGRFETAPDLFDAVSPNMEYEKALVIGYWFQVVQAQPDFTGQEVNTALKHIGHRIANITDAFSTLIHRKPALVMQTQKTGSSRQARKQYRLTIAGIRWVESRLANPTSLSVGGEILGETTTPNGH